MPAQVVDASPQLLAGSIGSVMVCGILIWAVVRQRRRSTWRPKAWIPVVFVAILFGTASGVLAGYSYASYIARHTVHYSYFLEVNPSTGSEGTVIVPIPTDEILVASLSVVSGTAVWSLMDTEHGRGLFVRYTGPVRLAGTHEESDATPSLNVAPTLGNISADGHSGRFWISYGGSGAGAELSISIQWWRWDGLVAPGWAEYPFVLVPPPVS